MVALAIPPLFYEEWVWMAICLPLVAVILAIRHVRREPPPKPHPFFLRHKKTISRVSDVFVICFVSAMVAFVLWLSFWDLVASPAEDEFRRQTDWQFACGIFNGGMTIALAWGGALLGLLSVFQAKITPFKRIALRVLCLLPLAFVVPNLSVLYSEQGRREIPLVALCVLPSWLVNGPAVLTGQPFSRLLWRLVRKLNLAPTDYAQWW